MKRIIPVLTIMLLYACSSTKNTAENWIGKSKNSLINSWGPPVRVIQDTENGNEILIYADQVYIDQSGANTKMAGRAYWDYVYVYTNKDGKIYSSKSEKQQLRPQEIAVK
ncbi:hypothetical protein [Flavobacterium sp. N1736]|uniref:hypothetical protein n=1 Tax=Flavobacterium sp. N1736 TaxID=2986823 RepID=UPI0022253A9D|nr:hypothetical protein [Flavobacterium sp. N1736]